MLAAVVVDLWLGAITSKSLHLPQPRQADMLAVLHNLIALNAS